MSDADPTLPASSGAQPVEMSSGAQIGRFATIGTLGSGGMGVVLEAHDPELDRRVAIKILHRGIGVVRLQREAQAMAKLSHPNVVAVYDVGSLRDQVFVAMELVDGQTLRAWMHESHPWREIVVMLLGVGRGIAAAHDAGLVHRDVKPENVLVGKDGRPRVTDFGLVAGAAIGDGTVVGTPAYMSQEQWTGKDVDARSDQFAFCVLAWEALTGQRPYQDVRTDPEIAGSVGAEVPRAVEEALRRGLAHDRAARWPDMHALLAALERAIAPRRRAPWIAAGAVVVAAGAAVAVVLATRDRPGPTCPDPRPRLAGIWDAERADALRRAFLATGHPAAEQAAARFIDVLDRRADGWVTMQQEACEATHVHRTASTAALDQRSACLDDRRTELGELAGAFITTTSADAIDQAGAALRSLTPLEDCADAVVPDRPELRDAIAEVHRLTATARARSYVGDADGAHDLATRALAKARELDDASTLVIALHAMGLAERNRRAWKESAAAYREGATTAKALGQHDRAAQLYAELIFVLAEGLEDVDGALALRPLAEAALAEAGNPPYPAARVGVAVGTALARAGDADGALAVFRRTAELVRAELGSDADLLVTALLNIANAHASRERWAETAAAAGEALEVAEAALGPEHPTTASALRLAGIAVRYQGDLDRAQALLDRALAIQQARFGPDDDRSLATSSTLANLKVERGDLAGARALHEQIVAALSRAPDPNRLQLATAIWALAIVVDRQDGHAAAEPHYLRALAEVEAVSSKDSVDYMKIEADYAELLSADGRCREAIPRYQHVVAIVSEAFPQYAPEYSGHLAQCHLELGDKPQSLAIARQALGACADCPPELAARLEELIRRSR
jgi:tetratricopeptide (TPR) repeat protein